MKPLVLISLRRKLSPQTVVPAYISKTLRAGTNVYDSICTSVEIRIAETDAAKYIYCRLNLVRDLAASAQGVGVQLPV